MENFRKEETKETQASERASECAELPANRIKFRSPATTTARKAAVWRSRDCRLQKSGSERNIKYCPRFVSLSLCLSPFLSLLAVYWHGHFILLVDTNRSVQYTIGLVLPVRMLERSFINFARPKVVDKKTARERFFL